MTKCKYLDENGESGTVVETKQSRNSLLEIAAKRLKAKFWFQAGRYGRADCETSSRYMWRKIC